MRVIFIDEYRLAVFVELLARADPEGLVRRPRMRYEGDPNRWARYADLPMRHLAHQRYEDEVISDPWSRVRGNRLRLGG